jgi:hypothetical protein
MRTIGIALLSLLLGSVVARADDLTTLAEAKKMTDRAVALFAEEQFAEAYGTLKPYWPLPEVEIDNLANQTSMQWPLVRQRFGATVGTEFVSQNEVGSSLARVVYLQKFQNHALRWVFHFYKPKDRWVINAVTFDDQLHLLF